MFSHTYKTPFLLALITAISVAQFSMAEPVTDQATPTVGIIPNASEAEAGKGSLLLTPGRIVLEGKERTAEITLANNGSGPADFRISLENKRMKEDGSILPAGETQEGDMFADQMIRFAPKKVRLEPGKSQTILVSVRKPRDLPDGEYRTHMKFMLIPEHKPETEGGPVDDDKNVSISIQANIGITIPIIVRQGKLDATVTMDKLALGHDESGKPTIEFSLNRTGGASTYGDLAIQYVNKSGKTVLLRKLSGAAVYTPITIRTFKFPLDLPNNLKLSDMTALKVSFVKHANNDELGDVLASQQIKL